MGHRIRTKAAVDPGRSLGVTGGDLRKIRNEALRGLHGLGSLVYAVRTNDGLVKIGCTRNLAERMRHIDGGVDEILALKPGSFDDERAIHDRLRSHVARGREFYYPTPAVLRVINDMRVALGMDPLPARRHWAS